jgi:predicted site-specific integrase-resolvase
MQKEQSTLVGALNLHGAAKYLSLSEITIRRLVYAGRLKPNRAVRRLIFPIVELDRFLARHEKRQRVARK